jgi:hypothetical protein
MPETSKEAKPLSSVPSDPMRLVRQVRMSISEIYFEHRNDLEDRKKRRQEIKNPTDYFNPYNLVVNSQFQAAIKLQIQSLAKASFGDLVKESVITCMNEFIEYLVAFVQEFDGKKAALQGVMIYEAYHTLLNSVSQVGGIVSELITRYAFEVINKKCFYEKVIVCYAELLEDLSFKQTFRYFEEVVKMKNELTSLDKIYEDNLHHENASTFYSDSCSDSEEASGDALHNLPIDELVKILNSTKEVKKKKRKRKSWKDEELDSEIKEFSLKLESEKLAVSRKTPNLSPQFLKELKEKLAVVKRH